MSARRILIVNLTRFGDLLQTSPTVAALRERHPGATVTLLADKNFAGVCEGIPGLDSVYRVDLDHLGHLLLKGSDELLESYRYVEQMIGELRAIEFDLALNFSSSRMTAVFMGLLGVRDTRGWSMTSDGMRVIRHPWARLFASMCLNRQYAAFNLVDYYRAIADGLGATRRLLYQVTPDAERFARETFAGAHIASEERVIALQLGASKAIRRWPSESFATLGRLLTDAGHRVVLVGGKGDRPLAAEVAARIGERAVDLCGGTSVAQLGAVLARADVLVTGDTGPMHMAAAVGTPIVGLFFGPALPFDTGPYGENNLLLHADVPCAPCDHNVTCLKPYCRDEIGPELVAATVVARLASDWRTVEGIARGAKGVKTYRTGFDRHGWFGCEQLGGHPASPQDSLREAYRSTFLSVLGGLPIAGGRATSVDTAPFTELVALARSGRALARRLSLAAAEQSPSLGRLDRLAKELEALDRSIAEHGAAHPDATILALMFKFGKENLEGDDVVTLAAELTSLYQQLEVEADMMRALLCGETPKEQVNDACLHQ